MRDYDDGGRMPQYLRQNGMLNEVHSYSDVTSSPPPRKSVTLCTSFSCSAHYPQGVIVVDRNSSCPRCGHTTITKAFFNSTLEIYNERERKAKINYEAERKFNDILTDKKREIRKLIHFWKKDMSNTFSEYSKKQVEKLESQLSELTKIKFVKVVE